MKEELDRELCAKYPKIFAQRHAGPGASAMHWGLAVSDGWYNILDQLCANIQWHIDQVDEQNERAVEHERMREAALNGDWSLFNEYNQRTGLTKPGWIEARRKELLEETPEWKKPRKPVPQVVAAQVKEKFGTLRFYYDGGDDVIQGMVRMAESMSAVMCEDCGAPGRLREGSWVRTLCDHHYENELNERNTK
jgi:hypothetical protein